MVMAVGCAIVAWANFGNFMASFSLGAVIFQLTYLFGLVPVAIYGAPLYTWMKRSDSLTWPRVVALGTLPGAVTVPFVWSYGATALVCGVAVSCLTHVLAKQDAVVPSNKSLERTREG